MKKKNISSAALKRLPLYLSFLKGLPSDAYTNISATQIASAVSLNEVQVRKDLAAVGDGGKPKVGYITLKLIDDIEKCIGCHSINSAAIVGTGNLGKALICSGDFGSYGLSIEAAFDSSENNIGTVINGKEVYSIETLETVCREKEICVGIITVPASAAQSVCDMLVASGVVAIWNFAPIRLEVPANVKVLDEHIGSSLPLLLNGIK